MHPTTASPFRFAAILLTGIVLTAGLPSLVGAPQAVSVDDLRQWNSALLRLQDRLPAGRTAAQAPIMQQQAAALLVRRSRALAALIRTDPDQALAVALPTDVLDGLRRAFPATASEFEVRGSWEGIVDYTIVDDEDLRQSEVEIVLQTGSERLGVHFAEREPAGLRAGVFLRVEGVRVHDEVAVEPRAAVAWEESIHAASAQNPVEAAGSCSALGEQRIAVIRATFPGVTPSLTRQKVVDTFFGPSTSLDGYWKEASYDQTWATGEVYPLGGGWYELDREYSCASGNDESALLRAKAIEVADPDIDYSQYERVVIVFPKPASGCCYAGLASLGCGMSVPDTSDRVSYAHQVADYMGNSTLALQLTCHEIGHNLGLSHAASRRFYAADSSRETLGAFGRSGSISTYGDKFSCLGSWVVGHYAVSHKADMGWLSGSAVANVTSTGQYDVTPTEASGSGTKALKIRRGSGNNDHVWVEYRQPTGSYDSSLPSQVFSGAMLHYEDSFTGLKSHLLDGTPGTSSFNDPAVPSGSTTVDAYTNLSIAVGTASSSALTVTVDFGPEPCTEADPSVSATPSNPSVDAGSSVDYSVVVTNNDSSGCGPASLSLSSIEPAGWIGVFSSSVVTLDPGQTTTVTLTESVDASSEPGTYPVDVTATQDASSMSRTDNVSATVTVVPDPCSEAAPTVTASPSSQSVDPGSSVSYNVTVTNNDSATCGEAVFSLSSNEPSAWSSSFSPSSLTLAPGATGTATLSETPDGAAASGTYPVGVTATHTAASLSGDHEVTATVNSVPDPCSEAAPTVTATPSNQSVDPGSSVAYTVTVVNNDSATCGDVVFSLSSTEPSAWSSSFSPSSLTLAPGATGTATLSETPDGAAASGTYPVGVTATHTAASLSGSDEVTATVNSVPDPCTEAAPTVTASPSNQSVDPGSSVAYNVTVVNNDSATCGNAVISLSSTEPSGWSGSFSPSPLTLAPGASGTATLTETAAGDAAAGPYAIGVIATHNSAGLSGDDQVTATVNSFAETHTLSIDIVGLGKVTSTDGVVNCTKDCSKEYAEGAQVELTAVETKKNMKFARWEGACAGTEPTCELTVDSDISVAAVFERPPRGRNK